MVRGGDFISAFGGENVVVNDGDMARRCGSSGDGGCGGEGGDVDGLKGGDDWGGGAARIPNAGRVNVGLVGGGWG